MLNISQQTLNDFFKGGGSVEDNFSEFYSTGGIVDSMGTLSFLANPGDKFYLITSLQTYGGRAGAISDASNTLKGNLISSQGTITALSSVPEPGSTVFGVVFAVGMLLRRKR